MEEYKGYYIEERSWTPGLMSTECVVYEDREKMTHGEYVQVFDSSDSAKAWIDKEVEEMPGVEFEGPMGIFHSPGDVSIKALVKAAVEITNAMIDKGVSPLDVVRMIRGKGGRI